VNSLDIVATSLTIIVAFRLLIIGYHVVSTFKNIASKYLTFFFNQVYVKFLFFCMCLPIIITIFIGVLYGLNDLIVNIIRYAISGCILFVMIQDARKIEEEKAAAAAIPYLQY